jgi:hypothetical protein
MFSRAFLEVATIEDTNDHASYALRFPLVIDDHQMALTSDYVRSSRPFTKIGTEL